MSGCFACVRLIIVVVECCFDFLFCVCFVFPALFVSLLRDSLVAFYVLACCGLLCGLLFVLFVCFVLRCFVCWF